ncbi:hypothetical protein MsAg5_00040 [Methanosarcinaceae archaeon Ag5]|uniref:Uncharacterized protein n=1 Tax=Methanolapillus africanus TaxID=3028297 RepID=A0AAE4MJA4_9EURY|nr:hypothetical protein [Methanosarcinaceae archaeon Ag5]
MMTMKNFTTGIPEIDRLTRSCVKGGSFLLFCGNDDEGMESFLALIERSGRQAEKEDEKQNPRENQKATENGCRLSKACPSGRKHGSPFHTFFIIDSISEEFSNSTPEEIVPKILQIRSDLRNKNGKRNENTNENKEKSTDKTDENNESSEPFLIGCLHEGILPEAVENRLKHIADTHFQFEMRERGNSFERTLAVYKYKTGCGDDAESEIPERINGKVFRYILDGGKFQIESKKRIY